MNKNGGSERSRLFRSNENKSHRIRKTIIKRKIKKTQLKHFTSSEEKSYRKSVEEGSRLRDNLMFDLLFDTGLRLSELTGINVGDVKGKKYLTIVGKGRKERTIPIWSVNGLKEEIIGFLEWKRDHGESVHPRSPLFGRISRNQPPAPLEYSQKHGFSLISPVFEITTSSVLLIPKSVASNIA